MERDRRAPEFRTQLLVSAWAAWMLDVLGAAVVPSRPLVGRLTDVVPALAGGFAVWVAVLAPPLGAGRAVLFRSAAGSGRAARTAGAILTWLVVMLAVAHWLSMGWTGAFPGIDGWSFFFFNLGGVLLHALQVEGRFLGLVAVVVTALAVAAPAAIERISRRIEAAEHPAFYLVSNCWAVCGAAVIMYAAAQPSGLAPFHLSGGALARLSPVSVMLLEGVEWTHEAATQEFHRTSLPGLEPVASAGPPSLTPEAKRIRPMAEYVRQAGTPAAPPYNVIIVSIESLRADRLASGGAVRRVMPNLDVLAARSATFAEAYCQSSHSGYADLCPLSSQYPLRKRRSYLYQNITYPRVLLYDILKAYGYRTAVFSSQNERWCGMLGFLDTGNLDTLFHSGNFPGPRYPPPDGTIFTWRWLTGWIGAGKTEDRWTMQAALEWMNRSSEQPFFCYLNLQNSHFPYRWPSDEPAVFQPADLSRLGIERFSPSVSFYRYGRRHLNVMRNRYDTSLYYVDQLIGQLIEHLRAQGLLERTIVVVTGDNGEMFQEHGAVTHAGSLWQEVLRVPLVVYAPGQTPRRITSPVQHIDVPPTVLALLGLPPHPGFQGRNALEASSGRPSPVFALVQMPWAYQAAVVSDGHKLIHDWSAQTYRLYDLRQDPGELRDRAADKPEMTAKLRRELQMWYALQLGYYQDPEIYSQYYQPSMFEPGQNDK